MESFTHFFNIFLTIGTLVTMGIIFLITYLFFFNKELYQRHQNTYALPFIVFISGTATFASLIYSLGIGFPPCDLCWYQRIFMYGIFFISITAWCAKETLTAITRYLKTFVYIGLSIALYHTIIYYTGYNPLPCSANVSCTARYVFEFGFVTIPLMSLVSFILLGSLLFKSTKK